MQRDIQRGRRIRKAIASSKIVKAYALAVEMDVSIAAVSKWQNGGEISLHNACELARLTDVSLDWLLLGRGTSHAHHEITAQTDKIVAFPRNMPPQAAMEAMFQNFMSLIANQKA